MAEEKLDWHLERGSHGDVVLIAGADRISLGPRDEALAQFTDFLVDEGWIEPVGHDDFEDPGDWGVAK
jgi:hypothetical protein